MTIVTKRRRRKAICSDSTLPRIGCSLAKHLMHERDGDRAFTDRGCHALDVAAANIADREDAWKARLQKMRLPLESPSRGVEIFRRNIGSSLDEAVIVERHTVIEPFGRRHRSRHY